MKNLTLELLAKAKTAKSAEELFEIAKTNNVDITEEEAKEYFEQLNASGAVSDEELGSVAGGGLFDDNRTRSCPCCGRTIVNRQVVYKCPHCGATIATTFVP